MPFQNWYLQVSNKIEETHSDVSQTLSAPYDAVINGLNSVAMTARSYSDQGKCSRQHGLDRFENSYNSLHMIYTIIFKFHGWVVLRLDCHSMGPGFKSLCCQDIGCADMGSCSMLIGST